MLILELFEHIGGNVCSWFLRVFTVWETGPFDKVMPSSGLVFPSL